MNLLAGALLLLGVVSVAIVCLSLLRRRAPAGGFYSDIDRAGAIFGVVGTAFAVLLAFVIFVAFESAFLLAADTRRVADSPDLLRAGRDP